MTVSLNEAAQLNPDSQCAGGDKTALPLLGTNYNYNRRRAFLPCLKARDLQPEDFDEMRKKNIQYVVTVLFMVFVSASWTSSCIGMLHKVKKGETLSGIARKYEVSLKSIAQTNSITSIDRLQIGEKLVIPIGSKPVKAGEGTEGSWYIVEDGDSLYSIARRHNIKDWAKLQRINGISNPKHLRVGQRIFIPGDESVGFAKPLRKTLVVTSDYGYRRHPIKRKYLMHEGIDFRAAPGTRVYASKTGRVTYASWKSGYGNIVIIQHQDDFSTVYGHLSRIRVSVGNIVQQRQIIGLSGNTGVSTGPHLHFEIRYKGKSENPARHLDLP